MKSFKTIFASFAALSVLATAVSCKDENGTSGSSSECYFFQEAFSFNVTSNPEIEIPVVRLGTSGDVTVNVETTGASIFNVPSQVTIKDGDRVGNLVVTYDEANLEYNEVYELSLSINGYSSLFGYGKAVATIEYPTSYYEYGKGTIEEGWWGEQEDKVMYARDYAKNVLQCYLPDCWGHDTGASYDVQNYYFYWNTETNKVYVPLQYMGTTGSSDKVKWNIADRGVLACMFGGPNHKEGSSAWMSYVDNWYKESGLTQPYYDPAKKTFYLSDTAAVDPATGNVVYGSAGTFDVFKLTE